MLKDKAGKPLEVGQLCDLHLPMMVTGLIIDTKHSPLEIPGSGLMPACITVQVTMTLVPQNRSNEVPCYIIRDAPPAQKQVNELEEKSNVTGFKPS